MFIVKYNVQYILSLSVGFKLTMPFFQERCKYASEIFLNRQDVLFSSWSNLFKVAVTINGTRAKHLIPAFVKAAEKSYIVLSSTWAMMELIDTTHEGRGKD